MKLAFKHIITVVTLACFLVATNGLSLVEHYCSAQEKSFLFLFSQDPDCEDHKCGQKVEEQACCVHEHTTDCCQNFNIFLKLVADYFSTHHDAKSTNCPMFIVERSFGLENLCCPSCYCHFSSDFSDDVGPLEQLLTKRTTELLL